MKKTVLDLGGELKIGDLIAISDDTQLQLAWYVSSTPSAMKVINLDSPSHSKAHYDSFVSGKIKGKYLAERFAKGFTFESITQSLIYNTYCRALKIEDPKISLQNKSVLDRYEESKKILNNFNFLAK